MKLYNNSKIIRAIYLMLSFLAIAILINVTKSNVFIPNTVCLWMLGFMYMSTFLIFVFDKIIIKKFVRMEKKLIIFVGTVLIAIVICCILPFNNRNIVDANTVEQQMRTHSVITVEALGEKNSKSKGFEICLEGIKVDGKDYNLYNLELADGWKFVDGRPTYNNTIFSKLEINLGKVNTYELIFRKMENAGIVNVKIGNYNYTYDLYSKKMIQRNSLDLSKIFLEKSENQYDKWGIIWFNIIYFAIIEVLVFSFIVYIISLERKKVILKSDSENWSLSDD